MILKIENSSSLFPSFIKPLILSLLIFNTVFGAEKKDISGTIRDSVTGESLVYANIIIEGSIHGATTNKDGFFVVKFHKVVNALSHTL